MQAYFVDDFKVLVFLAFVFVWCAHHLICVMSSVVTHVIFIFIQIVV
jgi:hypothetical protein